ncbi:MAG: phosphoribosylformylglycinamidine cyclo-ligase [Rickettsiales bacterium]|jgi:phosphoribosylaminoimidazole synthetase|nr:phosphoribosylformylglycinamidine cyclo-ligase [Rickettsiales bacterium]
MNKITYKDSGVDTEKSANMIADIKANIESTHIKGVMSRIGGFAGLFDLKATGLKDPILVTGTDGVGTKVKLAIDYNKHDGIGSDLVAMCVNDILVQGAKPLFFLDYFACGKLDTNVSKQVINSVVNACKEAGCALVGGETAEMPTMYQDGDYDLAGFTVGAVERDQILPKAFADNSYNLIGIASSGLHANGFSLIHKMLKVHNLDPKADFEFDTSQTLIDSLLTPTRIYVKELSPLLENSLVMSMCHITGGGFDENMPRIIPEGYSYELNTENFPDKPIWQWVRKYSNLDKDEMLQTFNCGIGMVLVIADDKLDEVTELLTNQNSEFYNIGKIIKK